MPNSNGKTMYTRPDEAGLGEMRRKPARWRYRCIVCRAMFGRPEYSDETKCPKCLASLLTENARGYKPKQIGAQTLQTYGITPTQYYGMFAEQGGTCAICLSPPRVNTLLHVDHNHDTGTVRGLLCLKCNTALGAFGDDPAVLARAVNYLRKKGDYSAFARSRRVRVDTLSEVTLDD